MRLFVAYHDDAVLRNLDVPPGTTKLYLSDLDIPAQWRDNKWAESRALLYLALNPDKLPAGPIGLLHASYPTKFKYLTAMRDIEPPEPGTVLGAVVGNRYLDQAEYCHKGIRQPIAEVLHRCGVPVTDMNDTVFCNTIVADRSVWLSFLPAWLRMFIAAQDVCNNVTFDTTNCKPGIAPAYLLERLTCAWFAASPYRIAPIPGAAVYKPVYSILHDDYKPQLNGPCLSSDV